MAADSTLTQASLKEALSRVGVDKTKFYESQVAIPLATSASMVNVFQKKNEEKQKAWDDIAEPVEVMMRQLASGSEQLGGMHPANVTRFKELQKEFNAAYGDKEKEDKIKFKIQQVAAEINGLAAGFTKFGEAYIGKDLVINEDDEFYKAFGKIWDVDGKYDDVSFNWDENNKLSVTIDGKTQKVTDLFKELHLKDVTSINGIGTIGVGLRNATAKNTKTWGDEKDIFQASIKKLMPDKSSYLNLIEDETLTGTSFKKALSLLLDNDPKNDDASLVASLGKRDAQTVYDTIVKGDNLEDGIEIVSKWFTEGYGKSKFNEGKKARKIDSLNTGYNDGFTYSADDIGGYSAEMKSSNRKQIDNRKTFGDYDGRRGYYVYNKKDDTYTITRTITKTIEGKKGKKDKEVEEEVKIVMSVFDVLKKEGLLRDGETGPSKSTAASSLNVSDDEVNTYKNVPEKYQITINGTIKDVREVGMTEGLDLKGEDFEKWKKFGNFGGLKTKK